MLEKIGHRPVLLEEALEALCIRSDGLYVDCTFGRGGHSGAILDRLGPAGRLIALDQDPEAEAEALHRFAGDDRFEFVRTSFTRLLPELRVRGLTGRVDGVLLDLGVSSPQLDTPERGFSFMRDGPLDMRMDPMRGASAAQWLARADEAEIAGVLKTLGEERFARRIARHLVAQRAVMPIERTGRLAALIAEAIPRPERHKHPATRSFQAIRLHVNRELDALDECLAQIPAVLAPAGRLAVISFHSLEDRIVKRFIRRQSEGEPLPRGLPVTDLPPGRTLLKIGKAQRAREDEVDENPRARSAVLRVAERLS
ncbi:16S rRNA (cytosine(1402)-N(4))-methyltransferase RsmH [Ectothiorhodospira lacustris]|uniref:16S rRNA (cytosine(1402)-N(4))-methyltransferase RsmH n=1 Tax=Ectothiorhodospira lacustris TaxID=2899127 RepID=UPI001EE79375|nr:16S rRNA (cytosine(1402)-N(4))-methyltransferase RsmH [Ectothiorhodospira lacustris]MCG5501412.1 16S rRNA (cytosine(1402)-N(4))-methyltransferase RsmH [Ectothiorhodospira lacustris]